jgi:hypothetical protein
MWIKHSILRISPVFFLRNCPPVEADVDAGEDDEEDEENCEDANKSDLEGRQESPEKRRI